MEQLAALRGLPGTPRVFSLRDRPLPVPPLVCGKPAAEQILVLLRTLVLDSECCGFHRKPAESRANSCAFPPGHRNGGSRGTVDPSSGRPLAESNRIRQNVHGKAQL